MSLLGVSLTSRYSLKCVKRTTLRREASWGILIFCSIAPFVAALLYFLPTQPTTAHRLLYFATKTFTLLAPFFFYQQLASPHWKEFPKQLRGTLDYKISKTSILTRGIPLGILLGLSMGLITETFFYFLPQEIKTLALQQIRQKITSMHMNEAFIIFALVISFGHSLVEEFYWRFFLFNAWKNKLPTLLNNLTSALSFSLHHFVITIFFFDYAIGTLLGVGVLVGAFLWQFTYEKEKNLKAVWISHILIDLWLMSFAFRALRLN